MSPQTFATEVNSGRLLRWGITGGMAAAMHLPVLRNTNVSGHLDATAVSVMPYVLLMPGYWFAEPWRAAYCSSPVSESVIDNIETSKGYKVGLDYAKAEWKQCTAKLMWLGAFFGVPLSFQANATLSGAKSSSQPFRPLGAFGIGLVPHPYMHLLIGASVSNVQVDKAADVHIWSPIVAMGGPFDLLSNLILGSGGGGKGK